MARFVKGAGFLNTAIGLAELKRDWNKEVEIKGKMVMKSNFEHASDIFCLSLNAASNVGGIKGAFLDWEALKQPLWQHSPHLAIVLLGKIA
tara:strand:- start:747 stop:1019 length:273 start_codon:yes stop_codon:yes gene_type:complete